MRQHGSVHLHQSQHFIIVRAFTSPPFFRLALLSLICPTVKFSATRRSAAGHQKTDKWKTLCTQRRNMFLSLQTIPTFYSLFFSPSFSLETCSTYDTEIYPCCLALSVFHFVFFDTPMRTHDSVCVCCLFFLLEGGKMMKPKQNSWPAMTMKQNGCWLECLG